MIDQDTIYKKKNDKTLNVKISQSFWIFHLITWFNWETIIFTIKPSNPNNRQISSSVYGTQHLCGQVSLCVCVYIYIACPSKWPPELSQEPPSIRIMETLTHTYGQPHNCYCDSGAQTCTITYTRPSKPEHWKVPK